MNGTTLAIYLPILIAIMMAIQDQEEKQRITLWKIKKRRGIIRMNGDLVKKYIGMDCRISTGSLGTNVVGRIVDVEENWIEVETKKGNELINLDFVQHIRPK